tara:strand:- start:1318 stop:1584 length:267 start_codon:yes stop_codon:yes gene_type:complete
MYINHKVIFKGDTMIEKDHFFCTLCSFTLTSFLDFSSSKKWDGICNECYLTFIEARKKEWKEGWRPDKETLETHNYNRKCQLIPEERK